MLTKIFKLQEKLDNAMAKVHNISQEEVSNKKILALLVEIGEFANELSSFKYWKKNKNTNKENILFEYADCMHFFASFYVQLKINKDVKPVIGNDLNDMFIELFQNTAILKNNINENNLDKAFAIYLGIGEKIGLSNQEIEEYYIKKNQINYERIKNNY
ncbi:MAG: dUTP diphosphatase [Mycoplasmatales bacterium]|nr:dUTP diphosphatase [Mycoplasmatales bacterium]